MTPRLPADGYAEFILLKLTIIISYFPTECSWHMHSLSTYLNSSSLIQGIFFVTSFFSQLRRMHSRVLCHRLPRKLAVTPRIPSTGRLGYVLSACSAPITTTSKSAFISSPAHIKVGMSHAIFVYHVARGPFITRDGMEKLCEFLCSLDTTSIGYSFVRLHCNKSIIRVRFGIHLLWFTNVFLNTPNRIGGMHKFASSTILGTSHIILYRFWWSSEKTTVVIQAVPFFVVISFGIPSSTLKNMEDQQCTDYERECPHDPPINTNHCRISSFRDKQQNFSQLSTRSDGL